MPNDMELLTEFCVQRLGYRTKEAVRQRLEEKNMVPTLMQSARAHIRSEADVLAYLDLQLQKNRSMLPLTDLESYSDLCTRLPELGQRRLRQVINLMIRD